MRILRIRIPNIGYTKAKLGAYYKNRTYYERVGPLPLAGSRQGPPMADDSDYGDGPLSHSPVVLSSASHRFSGRCCWPLPTDPAASPTGPALDCCCARPVGPNQSPGCRAVLPMAAPAVSDPERTLHASGGQWRRQRERPEADWEARKCPQTPHPPSRQTASCYRRNWKRSKELHAVKIIIHETPKSFSYIFGVSESGSRILLNDKIRPVNKDFVTRKGWNFWKCCGSGSASWSIGSVFFGPHPDPLVTSTAPAPNPALDSFIIKQKKLEKPLFLLFCDVFMTFYLWRML